MRKQIILLGLVFICLAGFANATDGLLFDFNNFTIGNLDTQAGWVANALNNNVGTTHDVYDKAVNMTTNGATSIPRNNLDRFDYNFTLYIADGAAHNTYMCFRTGADNDCINDGGAGIGVNYHHGVTSLRIIQMGAVVNTTTRALELDTHYIFRTFFNLTGDNVLSLQVWGVNEPRPTNTTGNVSYKIGNAGDGEHLTILSQSGKWSIDNIYDLNETGGAPPAGASEINLSAIWNPDNINFPTSWVNFNGSVTASNPFSCILRRNDTGLVSHWSFDYDSNSTNTSDNVGSNDGIVVGATYNMTGGYDNFGAYNFDGSDDYILSNNVIDVSEFNEITLSVWVKYNEPIRLSNTNIIDWEGSDDFGFYSRGSSSNELRFIYRNNTEEGSRVSIFSLDTKINQNEWTLITGTINIAEDTVSIYLNGELFTTNEFKGTGFSTTQLNRKMVIGARGSKTSNFNGSIDEVMIFNKSLSATEVLNLYNQTRKNFSAGTDIPINFSQTVDNEGILGYTIDCNDNNSNVTSTEFSYYIDITPPLFLENSFVNNSIYFDRNLTGQFNFSDNILLHSINVTIDNNTIFLETPIAASTYELYLNYSISNLTLGRHILGITIADGHTATVLGGDYNVKDGIFNNYLKYTFYDYGNIKTKLKDSSWFDTWKSIKLEDRYIQILKPANPSSTIILVEEASKPIYILNKEGVYNNNWIVTGNHWKDYVLKNEPDAVVSIKRIDDYNVEVTISGIKNIEELEFESVGDLNVVTKEWEFYNANMTETFEQPIFSKKSTDYNLFVDFGRLEFNITGLVPEAMLQLNDTNKSATLDKFNTTSASFSVSRIPPEVNNFLNITHQWFFNLTNLTTGHLITNETNQTVYNVQLGVCEDPLVHNAINFTYFDEITDDNITADNAYQVKIFDGTFYYNQTGSFSGNTTDYFCTNINPSIITYNWDMWGTLTLSKTNYITRIIDIDEGIPIGLSNNPTTNQPLFLIPILNSSTVKFNWFSTNFELLDGTMRIFQCNPDGSKDLIESTPVIAGLATANLELLTQPYSYDIIVGGLLFENNNGYTKCHVESQTELTFYVDIDPVNIAELIGLSGIPCSLNKTGNDSVLMEWGLNPEKDGYISGCITAYRKTIKGNTEVYNNCSVETDGFSREVTIPIVGNTYVITGRLEQGDNIVVCGTELIFSPDDEAGGLFGASALFAVFLLVASLALIYAGDGHLMLAGAGVGLVASWFIGILIWDWITVSAVIVLLAIVAITGRYTRKPL